MWLSTSIRVTHRVLQGPAPLLALANSTNCFGMLSSTRVLRAPKRKPSVARGDTAAKKLGTPRRSSSKAAHVSPSVSVPSSEVPCTSHDILISLTLLLNAATVSLVPASANINVYIAWNIASSERLVPSVLVRKGLDPFSTHIFTSPIDIRSKDQAEEFVAIASARLTGWLTSQGIILSASGGAVTRAPCFKEAIGDVNFGVDALSSESSDGLDITLAISTLGSVSPFGATRRGGRAAARVEVGLLGLETADESGTTTAAHRSLSAVRSLQNGPRPASADGDELPMRSSFSTEPVSGHLSTEVLSILHGRYPSNLYYFRGENLQSVQNKRGGVLYKQIRQLQRVLGTNESAGFVSVKIFKWSECHQHFTQPAMLRGHTMDAMPAREVTRWVNGRFETVPSESPLMVDITKAAPSSLDPDAYFISVELFTGDVMEAGQLAHNAMYPPLEVPRGEALLRPSVLPKDAACDAADVLRIMVAEDGAGDVPSIDSTRMWMSSNRRFFARFADASHGPIGVLREMIGQLVEAFDVGTAETFSEGNYLCKKIDANVNYHLPKNFAEILTRHFLGHSVSVGASFLASASDFMAEVSVPLCGNYFLDHEGNHLSSSCSTLDGALLMPLWDHRLDHSTFNGGRDAEATLNDLSLDNMFSPLSGFPEVVVGWGVGCSKKDAADPGLMMHIRRNFYREIGVLSASTSLDKVKGDAIGIANTLLSSRLAAIESLASPALLVQSGCAAARFNNVRVPNFSRMTNSQFLTNTWGPLLEEVYANEQRLLGQGVGSRQLGARMDVPTSCHTVEERAIFSLRKALSVSRFRNFGFTIHSSVADGECPSFLIAESGGTARRAPVWTSEIVVENQERTVLAVATAARKHASKHNAVLAALSAFSPEDVLSIPGQGVHSFLTASASSDSSEVSTAVAEDSDDTSVDSNVCAESYDPLSEALLEGSCYSHDTLQNESGIAETGEGYLVASTSDHVFVPATSMVSQYRRAIQMQIEVVVSEAEAHLKLYPRVSISAASTSQPLPYWLEVQPLRQLFESKLGGLVLGEDVVIREVFASSESTSDCSHSLGRGRVYSCALYAFSAGVPQDDRSTSPGVSVLLASSGDWPSPPLARLNAFSTAFHGLVHDPLLIKEAESLIGGGAVPQMSIGAPSLSSLCDMSVYHLGQRATVVRTGTVTVEGRDVSCASIIVPNFPMDMDASAVGVSPASDGFPQNWALSVAFHANPSAAENIAILSALKAMNEAAQPSGSVPQRSPRSHPPDHRPPPVAFTVGIGSGAAGYLAKALTMLLAESQSFCSSSLPPVGSAVTVVLRGLADPARLRLLWDDRMWGCRAPLSAARNIEALAASIQALLGFDAPDTLVGDARPQTNVVTEAASGVGGVISHASLEACLFGFDPDRSAGDNDAGPVNGGVRMVSLPTPLASSSPQVGVLAAIEDLLAGFSNHVADEYCLHFGADAPAKQKYQASLSKKLSAIRMACLHTIDANTAVLSLEGTPLDAGIDTQSLPSSTRSPVSSKGVLGSRRDFNRVKHLKFENYLDRFVLMLFGKSLDVFYSRPASGVRHAQHSSYKSLSTRVDPLGGPSSAGGPQSSVVHDWYCVLGIEVFGEAERSLFSATISGGDSNIPSSVRRRVVMSSQTLDDRLDLLAIGSLAKSENVGVLSSSAHGAISATMFTTDTDSIRKGFGGSVADVRPGFVILGFGSGSSKKDAHASAALNALRWHFPEQHQELIRRGVR